MRISQHREGINSEEDAKLDRKLVGFVVCFDRQVVNVDRGERLMMWPNLAARLSSVASSTHLMTIMMIYRGIDTYSFFFFY